MEQTNGNVLPTEIQKDVIETSLNSLLKAINKQDPNLAGAVARRWREDQQAFVEAVKTKTEGRAPESWSSSNCGHCYGRGYTGRLINTNGTPLEDPVSIVCKCAKKNYNKWLKTFREEFKKQREKDHVSEESTDEAKTLEGSSAGA